MLNFLISSGNIKINSALQANSLLTNPLPSQVAMPLFKLFIEVSRFNLELGKIFF